MRINLTLDDQILTGTLHDTPTARDFASMLPLTLTLEDYSTTEKISDLPRKLAIEGSPSGAGPFVGDIAYYAPWGNLALFYKDFSYLLDMRGHFRFAARHGQVPPRALRRRLEAYPASTERISR